MAKKGVSKISGNISPIVGEKNYYNIVDWYPATLSSEKNSAKITWELFKKRRDGRFTTTQVKKIGANDFTFGESAIGETFRLEAYLYEPEGGGLIITPKPSKIPKITNVELFYVDNTKGSTFSFMETLRVQANCVNMFWKELVFILWEDDAKGEGHNSKNKPIASKPGRVNEKGIAVVEFQLTQALMKKAMEGEADVKQLEFYVTVEYYKNKKHATENVNVDNPFPKVPISPPKKTEPTPPKAKGSPAESKGNSKKEEKGILETVEEKWDELWDWWESKGTIKKDQSPTRQVPEGRSPAIVKAQPQEKKEEENGKCPRCKKLTEAELKAVFPSVIDPSLITEIVNSFNTYCEKFNVNTCTLKAHFFAQAKQESGDSLSPAVKGESMDYGISGLKSTGFKNVSSSHMFGHKNGLQMAEELGRKKGEAALSIDRQIKIANFVYGLNPKAKDLGNKSPTDNQNLSELDNEGWKYRGRGMLQITGKNNYTNIEDHVNKVLGKAVLDIKGGRKYDGKFTATEALLSGLGDWDLHKMYVPAKVGVTKDACLNVIKIINSKTKSKTKRIAYLIGGKWYVDDVTSTQAHTIKEEKSMKSIFRVDECLLKGNPKTNTAPKSPDEKPKDSKVVIKFGKNADKIVVSEKSLNILRDVGEQTKNYLINITSTARDPYNQARVMYDNIVKNGMKKQRGTYKEPGQRVLDAYESAHAKGKSRDGIIAEMEAKIKEIGPSKVSRHCGDPKIVNVFDVSQALSNPQDFKRTITSKIKTILDENGCYHLEITQ